MQKIMEAGLHKNLENLGFLENLSYFRKPRFSRENLSYLRKPKLFEKT